MKNYKVALKYVWGLILVTILLVYLIAPSLFTIENFKFFFESNENALVIAYILSCSFRALFFIPSTFMLILGIALFPDDLIFLLIINMIGILIGSSFIYGAGRFFTDDNFFSAKHQEKLPIIKDKINQHGFWIVLGWSFFPLVPTDLVCYVAGSTHMKFIKFITALFIGEFILVSIYLYTGKGIFEWLIGLIN